MIPFPNSHIEVSIDILEPIKDDPALIPSLRGYLDWAALVLSLVGRVEGVENRFGPLLRSLHNLPDLFLSG